MATQDDWIRNFYQIIPRHLRRLYVTLLLMARSRRDLRRLHDEVVPEDHRLNREQLVALEQIWLSSYGSGAKPNGAPRQPDVAVRALLPTLLPSDEEACESYRWELEYNRRPSKAWLRCDQRILNYERDNWGILLEVGIEGIPGNFLAAFWITADASFVVVNIGTRVQSPTKGRMLVEKLWHHGPSPHNVRQHGEADFWVELPTSRMDAHFLRIEGGGPSRMFEVTAKNADEFASHPFFRGFLEAFTEVTGLRMTYVQDGKRYSLC